LSLPDDLQHLLKRLGLAPDAAYDPLWSAAPDFLELIADHTLSARPTNILECGCGITTLLLAACCARNGVGHVFSLENGVEFAARTRAELARHGLAGRATVLDAPLVGQRVAGHDYLWYDLSGLPPDLVVGMLVVDGPPARKQPDARYPALPRLIQRLTDDCVVFLDDADRPGERDVVARWVANAPTWRTDFFATERGCAVLRRSSRGMGRDAVVPRHDDV